MLTEHQVLVCLCSRRSWNGLFEIYFLTPSASRLKIYASMLEDLSFSSLYTDTEGLAFKNFVLTLKVLSLKFLSHLQNFS